MNTPFKLHAKCAPGSVWCTENYFPVQHLPTKKLHSMQFYWLTTQEITRNRSVKTTFKVERAWSFKSGISSGENSETQYFVTTVEGPVPHTPQSRKIYRRSYFKFADKLNVRDWGTPATPPHLDGMDIRYSVKSSG